MKKGFRKLGGTGPPKVAPHISSSARASGPQALSVSEQSQQAQENLLAGRSDQEIRIKRLDTLDLECSSCAVSQICPEFKAGNKCFYLSARRPRVRAPNQITAFLHSVLEAEIHRLQKGLVLENISGGLLNKEVSARLDSAFDKLERLQKLERAKSRPDRVSVEGEGLIARLFGDLGKPAKTVEARIVNSRPDSSDR